MSAAAVFRRCSRIAAAIAFAATGLTLVTAGAADDEDSAKRLAAQCDQLRAAGNSTLALHHCTRALVSGTLSGAERAKVLHLRAGLYLQEGLFGRAIGDYDRIILIQPDDGLAFSQRGLAHRRRGEVHRAIADTERAIELSGSAEIRRIQAYLKARRRYTGEIDGIYGTATRSALRACITSPNC